MAVDHCVGQAVHHHLVLFNSQSSGLLKTMSSSKSVTPPLIVRKRSDYSVASSGSLPRYRNDNFSVASGGSLPRHRSSDHLSSYQKKGERSVNYSPRQRPSSSLNHNFDGNGRSNSFGSTSTASASARRRHTVGFQEPFSPIYRIPSSSSSYVDNSRPSRKTGSSSDTASTGRRTISSIDSASTGSKSRRRAGNSSDTASACSIRSAEYREARSRRSSFRGARDTSPVHSLPSRPFAERFDFATHAADKYPGSRAAIEALKRAGSHERRIACITTACAEFDHWDDDKRKAEISYGAAGVLSVVLSTTDDDDEIRMLCAALEMMFRGSQLLVQTTYQEVGPTVVPLLLRVLGRADSGWVKHADVIIMNVTKIFLYLSRVPDLRIGLLRRQGLLDALARVDTAILNTDCRIARTKLIANLANCEANKVVMLNHEKLLGSLLRVAVLDAVSDSAREYAGSAIMDLASSPDNQLPMANNDQLLATLVKLAVHENVSVTRESAVTAIQNLAFAKENRVRLVTYGSGVVLTALKKTMREDPNEKARRRSAGALTNLACKETGEQIGGHKGLLETLAIVSTKDESDEVQTRASLALTKLAACITYDMDCHETLLDALVVASLSLSANGVSTVLRVKAREPENRQSMANHSGILETLSDICSNASCNVKDRENAMRAIMHLTNDANNVKAMCIATVLDALVIGASLEGPAYTDIRESAVVAMERLATEFSNRQSMARHKGLLVVVAKETEREAQIEESGESKGKSLLAKPLLMSLLVAM